jgi:aquaporin TIP
MGTNFPKWMLEISSYLPYLTSVKLHKLTCDSLPPLGMLANLRLLSVWGMPNIMKIGKEFYGEEGACKRLRVIQLISLKNLEEWWTTQSGEEEDEFLIPNLHQLRVSSCPKLKFLPYPPKSMYWDLTYSDEVLPPAVHGFGRLSSSTVPFQARITCLSFTADMWGRLQHLATLEDLTVIDRVRSSLFLPEATPYLPSLRSLCLCLESLEILPEWLGQLITLEELSILSSPNLTSLPQSIRNLTALKKLSICDCPRLVERCKGEDAHKISHIPEVWLFD